jgi:hypothetical protein
MILVAAAALGFGAVRGWLVLRSQLPEIDSGPLPPRLLYTRDWHTAARLVLLSLTMAIIPLALRPPRESFRRLWGRPGTVVPIAVGLAVLACLVDEHAFHFVVGFHYLYASRAQRLFSIITEAVAVSRAATAVGVAWLALSLAGRWEPEVSWVGRFGRALGFTWIGSCLGYRAYELVMYLVLGQLVV